VVIVVFVTFLPFARGLLAGHCFFWRDLAQQFFPLRLFAVEGLSHGEVRLWNPYAHEGELLPLPTLSYPFDVLHVLWPGARGLSLALALHVSLAGVGFLALARRLGVSWPAACGGAFAYALGGFCLSSLNLYVHLQGEAWAPFVVLVLIDAARGGRRECAIAAAVTAVAVSTVAVEITAQAVLVGIILAMPESIRRGALRIGASLALAAALTAPTILYMRQVVQESGRQGAGIDIILQHALHPMMLLQVVVAGLFGDTARQVDEYSGFRFSPTFPYFSSLYLGLLVIACAVVGACFGRTRRLRLAALAAFGTLVSVGAWARLDLLIAILPAGLRVFRFPSKAFFTAHLALALLAALGIDSLGSGASQRSWRMLVVVAGGFGGLLIAASALLAGQPVLLSRLGASFFPMGWPPARQLTAALAALADAQKGGLIAATAAGVAALVVAQRVTAARAVLACITLLATDLLRGGAGINPMVTPSFYELSPEVARLSARLRATGGRVFSCEPEFSEYWRAVSHSLAMGQDNWVGATYLEALVAYDNVLARVPSAYSLDQTSLTPGWRLMSAPEVSCDFLPQIVERLRAAGVTHVISYTPRSHPELTLEEVLRPRRVAPLALHVYALARPLPRFAVARRVQTAHDRSEAERLSTPVFRSAGGVVVEGPAIAGEAAGSILSQAESANELSVVVESDRPAVLVVRDAWATGWTATVDGASAPLWRADGRHRAVPVPAGQSRIVLYYAMPGMGFACLIAAAAGGLALVLARRPRRRAPAV
jgi:hypothetical protein